MSVTIYDGDGTGAYHVYPSGAVVQWHGLGDLYIYDAAGNVIAIHDGEGTDSVDMKDLNAEEE